MSGRPRYHASDQSRDILALDTRTIDIADARRLQDPLRYEREGFVIAPGILRLGEKRFVRYAQ